MDVDGVACRGMFFVVVLAGSRTSNLLLLSPVPYTLRHYRHHPEPCLSKSIFVQQHCFAVLYNVQQIALFRNPFRTHFFKINM